MKKYLYILFATCLLASCNTDNLGLEDPLSDFGYEFKETNLSVLEVLCSADYWSDDYLERTYYTEPNGKGKSYAPELTPVGGQVNMLVSATYDRLRFYDLDTNLYPICQYYSDYALIKAKDNVIVFSNSLGKERRWEILKYDEEKIVFEMDYNGRQFDGVEYPYCRVILHKRTASNENWENEYVSSEEYNERIRQWYQEYWESKSIEYLEDYVADELESGRSTLEQLHEYFKYICPELYESTIKYILEKYK